MRTPEWVWTGIAEELWPYASRGVYGYLLARRKSSNGQCYPSMKRMQRDLNIGEWALRAHIKTLIDLGLVTKWVVWRNGHRKNVYYVHAYKHTPGTLARPLETKPRKPSHNHTAGKPSHNSPFGELTPADAKVAPAASAASAPAGVVIDHWAHPEAVYSEEHGGYITPRKYGDNDEF